MATGFLKSFALVLVSVLALVGIFNLAVDPYDLFSTPKITGFNAEKTQYPLHTRMAKAHAVRFGKPRGLILGNSRAEYGLDPQHPAWAPSARPVYNLALSNGRIEEALLYLQHAHAHSDLRQVVLAVDFFMFNTNYRFGPGFDLTRLNRPDGGNIATGWFSDIMNALFSLDALSTSFDTIFSQGQGDNTLYQSDGMRNAKFAWKRIRAKGGHRNAFLADTRYNLRAEDGWPLFTLAGNTPGQPSPTLDAFVQLVRFCLEQDIELKIIISPAHARKLEVIHHLGLWNIFEYWKLRMVTIVENENQRIMDSKPAELWDFTGYNPVTTEPVPPSGSSEIRMRWYWEGSHYRREVGDKVLNCILGRDQSACYLGQRLTTATIPEHLTELRDAGQKYRDSHPEDVREIQQLIQETATEREKLRRRSN